MNQHKYDLTPKPLFSEEELDSVKSSLKQAGANVDKAEAIVRALGLTDFELHILAKRLSGELAL